MNVSPLRKYWPRDTPCSICGKPIGVPRALTVKNPTCGLKCRDKAIIKTFGEERIKNESNRAPLLDPIPEYTESTFLVFCDPHCPRHHAGWINFMVETAKAEGVKAAFCIGDLFDFDELSNYLRIAPGITPLESIKSGCEVASAIADNFDKLYVLMGNHDVRLARRLHDAKFGDSFGFMDAVIGRFLSNPKVDYIMHTNALIHTVKGDYRLFHPDEYRKRTAPNVEVELCSKYHCHCLGSHGHLAALKWSICGRYLAAQLGCCADFDKIEYKHEKVTTHPEWQRAFGIVTEGKFRMYVDHLAWRN